MNIKHPKIISIVGTNASGKSAIGIELAKAYDGEIISADSRQVYKGFDLCCGKVTNDELQIVPHHLLNVREIGEPFSVANFQHMAYDCIMQILQREKIPFIVGGTGLYVSSIVDGYVLHEEMNDIELRNNLDKLSLNELHAMLTPANKAYFDTRPSELYNKRRVIRVIEKTAHGIPLYHENLARFDVLQLGITWPKEILYERIEERLEMRIKQGMIDEVKSYLNNGGNQEFLYSLGLEYRHILWYLTGKYQTMEEFKFELLKAIKRFAKRQMTWFNRDKSINWLDMNSDYLWQAHSLISDFLGR